MQPLIIKPRAIGMAKEAYDWYEQQSKGLGEIFLSELNTCYKKIEAQPAFYSKAKKNFRQLRLKRFPYVVVYEILKSEVVVFAVFHTSRNPKYKFKD
jgi:mRNA-degrading endonuclease RelE of RelBE toxin-antitoxin system